MSGFSSDWLALRETADRRSRNRGLADALSARFLTRDAISIIDLGCGTGSNLRAIAPLLPNVQTWILADNDSELLNVAKTALRSWATMSEDHGDSLELTKDARRLWVSFRHIDLAQRVEDVIAEASPDLVTSSALFDLTSLDFMRRTARSCADKRAAFYTALTYNGIQKWTPRRPADNQIVAAFHRHQLRDKGFGAAAGPTAPAVLADQFRLNGFTVQEADSPWMLGKNDAQLIVELKAGHASAVTEAGGVDAALLRQWMAIAHTGVEIGHTDIFAVPAV